MKIWIRQHLTALKSALIHIRTAPGNFLFNVLVVTIALALPAMGLTLLENVRPVSEQITLEPEISVFLHPDMSRSNATALSIPIKKLLIDQKAQPRLQFIPKEKALNALQQGSNLSDVLATLGGNPLPDAYIVTLKNEDADKVEAIVETLKVLPGVDVVQVDSAWVKRLAALIHLLQLALIFLAATLGVVVIVVIFNATRLQVVSHQNEISVARLLGATSSYLYKPYYYSATLLAVISALLALGLIWLSLHPINTLVAEFARLYANEFQVQPLSPSRSALIVFCACLLGILGAWLSVRRQIAKIS